MLNFALAALALGVKHSFDPDHLLAISNMMTRCRSLRSALTMSLSWSAGHMAGAIFVTILLFVFKDAFIGSIFGSFEAAVAVMLVAFGALGIHQAINVHEHGHGAKKHSHIHIHLRGSEKDHSHEHIFGIGLLQGLASNDELILLLTLMLGLSSLVDMAAGVAIFSLGVVIGMTAFGFVFSLPLLRGSNLAMSRLVSWIAGALSVAWGLAMLAGMVPISF